MPSKIDVEIVVWLWSEMRKRKVRLSACAYDIEVGQDSLDVYEEAASVMQAMLTENMQSKYPPEHAVHDIAFAVYDTCAGTPDANPSVSIRVCGAPPTAFDDVLSPEVAVHLGDPVAFLHSVADEVERIGASNAWLVAIALAKRHVVGTPYSMETPYSLGPGAPMVFSVADVEAAVEMSKGLGATATEIAKQLSKQVPLGIRVTTDAEENTIIISGTPGAEVVVEIDRARGEEGG